MRRPCRQRDRVAFTLVEALVVIAIIGVIIGLVVPALSSVRAESKSTLCLSNLRQIFEAIDTSRHQRSDMLPYAAPLPLPPFQSAFVPALPERLKAIVPQDASMWLCPADETQESEDLGTSYVYIAGAFMLLEPPLLPQRPGEVISEQSQADRVARLVTQRYTNGYLQYIPIVGDSGDYHAVGGRQPRNALFMDGSARIVRPSDGQIVGSDNSQG